MGWFYGLVQQLPDDLPLVERNAVRVVLQDRCGRVLLFRARELTLPELGQWWELPGGGIEDGEDYREAALRELREETGLRVERSRIGPALWKRTSSYRFRGTRRLQHEVVTTARIDLDAPDLDVSGQLRHESEDYLSWRWLPVEAVVSSAERFYPGRLPGLLPVLLSGKEIDEPFEFWS